MPLSRDQKNEVARLYANKMSAGMIADRLGVTRNTICGVIFRERLAPRETKVRKFRSPPRSPPRPAKVAKIAPASSPAAPVVQKAPPWDGRPITFMQLTALTCRWPVGVENGAVTYCGRPHERRTVYCSLHAKRARQ